MHFEEAYQGVLATLSESNSYVRESRTFCLSLMTPVKKESNSSSCSSLSSSCILVLREEMRSSGRSNAGCSSIETSVAFFEARGVIRLLPAISQTFSKTGDRSPRSICRLREYGHGRSAPLLEGFSGPC